MITTETIEGRQATVAYIDDDFMPVSPDDATMIKIIFDDGEVRFGVKSERDQRKAKFQKEKLRAEALLNKLFNEAEHPRDDHGRWTDSGFAFTSPSVRDDLKIDSAVEAINSGQHKALRDASHYINKELGQAAHGYDIVGAWSDGAENSVMDIVNKSDWETLKVSAAMKGHLADQKQVLVFQDGEGNSALYSFKANGDVADIHERLLKEGLAFHTLVPVSGGAQVFIADTDLSLHKIVEKAADGAEITTDFGRAEFIGTTKQDGTDREQRDDARRAYEAIISQSPVQNSQAVWEGARNRWGSAEQGDLISSPHAKDPTAASSLLRINPNATVDTLYAKIPGSKEQAAAAEEKIAGDGVETKSVYKLPNGHYAPDRLATHYAIDKKLMPDEAIRAATVGPGERPTLYILGGRGGSGKGWFTDPGGTLENEMKHSVYINNDNVKEQMPEWEGWNAGAVHEEASDIAEDMERYARTNRLNTIVDATLKSKGSLEKRIALFKAAGYKISGHYMYASPDAAATRALGRFVGGNKKDGKGRYVRPQYSLTSTTNEDTFDSFRDQMDYWEVYDNMVPQGAQPKLHSRKGG